MGQCKAVWVWLAGAVLLAPAVAWAHPHGSIHCSAEVRLQDGRLAQLRGALVLDEAHSNEALAAVGGTETQDPDPVLLARFAFGLKRQFGRLNWLFALDADGQAVPLQASDPELTFEGRRLRIAMVFESPADPVSARQWSLRCTDPSYYWVTSFRHGLAMTRSADPSVASAVQVHGCNHASLAVAADESREGVARHDWRCD